MDFFSPGGAAVYSQGREPLARDGRPDLSESPGGAIVEP